MYNPNTDFLSHLTVNYIDMHCLKLDRDNANVKMAPDDNVNDCQPKQIRVALWRFMTDLLVWI